eukprot:1195350-Prorocentrum_minimum.AAC.4
MVLAGHRYNQAGQRWHAIRAYTSVLAVYRAKNWTYIEEHLQFALARQVAHIGDLSGAATYFVRLLASCLHQSASQQVWAVECILAVIGTGGPATYLREFLYVVQNLANPKEGGPAAPGVLATLNLPLPSINLAKVHVHFQDHRSYGSAGAVQVPEAEWTAVESAVCPAGGGAARPTWLDQPSHHKRGQEEETSTCVAGEEVGV